MLLPGRRRVCAGCISATCVPDFEFHGNPAWDNPFKGDVTLTGANNITSFGKSSFHSFNDGLQVTGSAKLERIGESAFSNAGGTPHVMPTLEFNGDFQFLTSIGDNAFKAIGRASGGKTYLKSGLTFNARNAFALRYIGKEAFGDLYQGALYFHVSSQCSGLVVHQQAFVGTTIYSIKFRSLDCDTLNYETGPCAGGNGCSVYCQTPALTLEQKKKAICPLSKYRPTGDKVHEEYTNETCCEAVGEIPCTRERYAGCGA